MALIHIKVIRGLGNREASPISDPLIVTEQMAIKRGKRYLDDPKLGAYYQTTKRTMQVPHKSSSIIPGAWVSITSSRLRAVEEGQRVTNVVLSITPKSVWSTISTETYDEVIRD